MSYTPYPKRLIDDIWSYSNRTLTQSKFPFWSSIINQTASSRSIGAGSSTTIEIQPPSGETWFVYVIGFLGIDDANSMVEVLYKNSSGNIPRARSKGPFPYVPVLTIMTNDKWLGIWYYNASSYDTSLYYSYSGFRLSTEFYEIKRTEPEPVVQVIREYRGYEVPLEVKPLEKYLVEVYDFDKRDYVPAILLEKDVVLARSRDGFPIERLTSWITVENFIRLLDLILREPVRTGFDKYLKKWRSEGIVLKKF